MHTPRFQISDDQRSIRMLLAAVIAKLGGNVVAEAENGEEAIAKYAEHKPDIVLMDINMPKMDGVSALKSIMAADPDATVVMLTSQDTLDTVQTCISAGAAHFILKSNSPDSIMEELAEVWAHHPTNPNRITG